MSTTMKTVFPVAFDSAVRPDYITEMQIISGWKKNGDMNK